MTLQVAQPLRPACGYRRNPGQALGESLAGAKGVQAAETSGRDLQRHWTALPGQVGKGALVAAMKPLGHLGAGRTSSRELMRAGCDDDVIGGGHDLHDGEAGGDQGQYARGQGGPSTREQPYVLIRIRNDSTGALLKNPQTLPERLARKTSKTKPEIKEKAPAKFDRKPGWKELAEKPVRLAKRLPRAIAVYEIKRAERAEPCNAAKAYGDEFKAHHAGHQRQERAERKEPRDWVKEQENTHEVREQLTEAAEQQSLAETELAPADTVTAFPSAIERQAALFRQMAEAEQDQEIER